MPTRDQKTQHDSAEKQALDRDLRFGRMAQHLINVMPLGVVAFDRQLDITDINPAAENMLVASGNIAKALSQGIYSDDHKDSLRQEWHDNIQQALQVTEPHTFENIYYTSPDGATRVLHIICTPLLEEAGGAILGGIVLIEDVTGKVMMEKDLAFAERLAAVGKLAARVAHELNNPLDGIMRYINLAMRLAEKNEDENAARYLNESRKGLQRMVQIVSELLEFSRSTYSAFEEANVAKIIDESLKAMDSHVQQARIQVIREYTPDIPNIRSGNLFQVFCNLIKNAVDAMETDGRLTIRTGRDDHYLIIEFQDNGPGLTEETANKLFEPFFTTKDPGKGTGLGLAICRDIIERYDGQINAANHPDGGALFSIKIPLARTSLNRK